MRTDVRARVARTEAEVEALRPLWAAAGPANIDADLDYFLTVVRHAPGVLGPYVVTIEHEGRQPVVVVARLVDHVYPVRFGYRELWKVRAKTLVVAFDGVLGARTEADFEEVADVLVGALADGDVDVLLFQKVEQASPLVACLSRRLPPRQLRVGEPVVRLTMKVPDSWDALLAQRPASSAQRIRRQLSVFCRDYGDRSELRRLDLPENRDALERDIERVLDKTYQQGLGLVTLAGDLQLQLMRLARDRGWLRVWMLYLDDAPVAFWWGAIYRGVLTPGTTGYDPAFRKAGIGAYTMLRMLEDTCDSGEVSEVDFGYGDGEYKQRFATESTMTSDVTVFAGRGRAMAVRCVQTAEDASGRLAHELAQRSRIGREIKRRWRSRGAPRQVPASVAGGERA